MATSKKEAAPEGELLPASTEARMALSVQRTISVKQYEPIQVFGSISFGADTPPEQIELLLGRFDELGSQVAEKVEALAQARAEGLRGSVEEAPRPQRQAVLATRRAPAAGGRTPNEHVTIEGRDLETYTNKEGGQAFKAQCEVCQAPVYFNPSVGRNGVSYSGEQNVKSALRFQHGFFCRNHKPALAAARPAPVQGPVEDDDLPF